MDVLFVHGYVCITSCMVFTIVCLFVDRSFMNVPPSLLACACLCDAVSYCVNSETYQQYVDCITQLAGVEQVMIVKQINAF